MQTTDIVSKFFITEYYTALHNDCKNMSRFYDSDCIVSITMDHNVCTVEWCMSFRRLPSR